jgi:hypothetical protein
LNSVGAYIIAYNEESVILGAIRSLKKVVDTVVVAISEKPYYGNAEPPDETEEIAKEEGCIVIKGSWRKEKDQRNACLDMLQHKSLIISSEADMWWEESHLRRLIDWFSKDSGRACRVKQIGYWFDTNHRFQDDLYKPVVAVKPEVRFVHIANPNCETVLCPDVHVHHLAWAAPKNIRKKVETYSHAPQIDKGWYDKHFKLTTRATLPDCELDVICTELPSEFKAYVTT